MHWHPYYTFTSGGAVPPPVPTTPVPLAGGGGTSSWERQREWKGFIQERSRRYNELFKKYLELEQAKEREAEKIRLDGIELERLKAQRLQLQPKPDTRELEQVVAKHTKDLARITTQRTELEAAAAKRVRLEKKLKRERKRLRYLAKLAAKILAELEALEAKMKQIQIVSMIAFSLDPRIQ